MNCHENRSLLSSWRDGELDQLQQSQVEAHLASCVECQGEADALNNQHVALRALFSARAESVGRVIAAVEAGLLVEPIVTHGSDSPEERPSFRRGRTIATHSLCMLIGFLLAVLLIASPSSLPPTLVSRGTPATPPAVPPAATLVVATGPVEYRLPSSGEWKPAVVGFMCPSSSSVRTTGNALCELKTADECVVRLDQQTELAFEGSCELTLREGKVWCQAPAGRRLVIRGAAPGERRPEASFLCSAEAATWTMARVNQEVECYSTAGTVRIETGQESWQLAPGKAMQIAGNHCTSLAALDRLQESRWMWPLLVRHGSESPELSSQVNALLSQLGRSKVSYLHESEIRSLGSYAALPLLRFVQAAHPAENGAQRVIAMQILADVAPVSFVPDLIELLGDEDPGVRVSAAAALQRLTGVNQGRAATEWRNAGPENDRELAAWRAWWKQDGTRFPGLWCPSSDGRL